MQVTALPCQTKWETDFGVLKEDMRQLSDWLKKCPRIPEDGNTLFEKISASRLNQLFNAVDPHKLWAASWLSDNELAQFVSACQTELSVQEIFRKIPNTRAVTKQDVLKCFVPILAFFSVSYVCTENPVFFKGLCFFTLIVAVAVTLYPSSHQLERLIFEAVEDMEKARTNEVGQLLIFLKSRSEKGREFFKEWNQLKEAYEETRV